MFRKNITCILFCLAAGHLPAQSNVYFLNNSGRQIWVQKRSILEQGSYPHTLAPGKTEYQSIPLQINEPAILNMVALPLKGPYGTADGIYYLLKPGDSLIVTLDQHHKPVLMHHSSIKRTRELTFIQSHMAFVGKTLPYTLYGFKGDPRLSKLLWSSDLKKRDRALDSLYRPYIKTAESFCKANGIDPDIGTWYRNYYWGSLLCDKLFVDRQIDTSLQKSLAVFYRDSLAVWSRQATCEDCNNVPAYKHALRKIFTMRFDTQGEHGYLTATAAETTGTIRDFLLSRHMLDQLETTGDPDKLLEHFDRLVENNIYKNLVHESYSFHARQSKISTDELATLIRPDKSEIGFTALLQKLKGHVVYIDFWASWCGPCVAEFPASHILNEKIKDQKIAMVYLSVDTDFNSWIKARAKHRVNSEYSFIMADPDKNKLARKINLGPIPRYIILDTAGNIIRFDAPRPSDPQIYTLLSEILDKKH